MSCATAASLRGGIAAFNDAHVVDNYIAGVNGDGLVNASVYGIYVEGGTGTVTGNRITGLVPAGTGVNFGIYATDASGLGIYGNFVNGDALEGMDGIFCLNSIAAARDNLLMRVSSGVTGCENAGNHVNLY